MSPASQFRGPARQRGAIGLIAAMTFGLALLFSLLVVDSGRLYLEQRKLQRVVDNAALEAVSRGGNCLPGLTAASYAGQSAVRNGFIVGTFSTLTTTCGSLVTPATHLRTFVPSATQSTAIQVVGTNVVPTSAVGALQALFSGASASANTTLTATAVAAGPKPTLAQLSIRSSLVSVDTARSNLLNPLFSSLLGGSVNLTALGWDGLVNTDINLLKFMDQLAIELGVTAGDYTGLLNAQGTVTQFIQAAATVANQNGASVDVMTALTNLQVGTTNAPPIKLGDVLQLQAGSSAASLDATVQLFQLVQGFVQLANKNSAVTAVLPVNVLGLLGVTTRIKVIEPPQFSAIGDPELAKADPLGVNRIYVKTAQVRVLATVDLSLINAVLQLVNTLLSPIIVSINTLLAPGCLLATCTQTDLQIVPEGLNLDVGIEAGVGSSYVTDYSCVSPTSKSLTATTDIAALTVKVGRIDPAIWLSSSPLSALTPLTLVDIGSKTCHGLTFVCGPRTPFAGGGSEIMIDASIAGASDPNYTYNNPKDINVPPLPLHTVSVSGVVGSLSGTLGGVTLIQHTPTIGGLTALLFNTLSSLLADATTALIGAIDGLLAPLVDPLINNLLLNLGIDVNKVDVGFNLTCGQKGKAYLAI
ncbi:pilus assembly protein TadG-related protein [Pseudomonas sp. 6D_7.1_Bac1]|uniref:pilus assembly protein TadG-related protein n=1 Tax=Pseudomonas sp. 6D_7.1_Bac1 TaxID=2971615 RepID=UPI0021C7E8D6|nr:pilus assembly protein TadG-related protein [Pseudomonas sp. 6D_7.1_Bac1]MCU1751451.1 pilus assembly protein TadG-related protein [Pseudomonas sp. 6D_7.1_Bac1]